MEKTRLASFAVNFVYLESIVCPTQIVKDRYPTFPYGTVFMHLLSTGLIFLSVRYAQANIFYAFAQKKRIYLSESVQQWIF
jgi:hypothetical protein